VKMSESTTNSTITDGSLLEISDAQLEGSDNEQENGELSSDGGSPKILSPNSSIKVGAEYGEPKKKKYKKLGKKIRDWRCNWKRRSCNGAQRP
jgi:hypothetical protein